MSLDSRGPKLKKKRKDIHPKGEWDCPNCGKHHEHPHWKDHHQTEKVNKKFCDDFCKESDSSHESENNIPKPLFCPCCGWEENRLIIAKIEKGEILIA